MLSVKSVGALKDSCSKIKEIMNIFNFSQFAYPVNVIKMEK